MKNPISEEILWQYVDNTLSDAQRLTVENHLKTCETSQALLKEIQTFNAEIAETVIEVPSMRFSKNVMEAIEEEVSVSEYQPLFRTVWKRMFASGFAAILLGLVGVSLTVASNSEASWAKQLNEEVSFLGEVLYSFTSSTFGIVVILSALWLLFALDKLFLSKRFG